MSKKEMPSERHIGAWAVIVHAPDGSTVYMYERLRSKPKLPWRIIIPWPDDVAPGVQTFICHEGNDLKIAAYMHGARQVVGLDLQYLGVRIGELEIPHIVDLMGNELIPTEGPLDATQLMTDTDEVPVQ